MMQKEDHYTSELIRDAADVLGLGERASMSEIKAAYRAMLKRWHPDTAGNTNGNNHAMTIRVQESYELLLRYCSNYRFPFRIDDTETEDEKSFWVRRFGGENSWGRG